MKEWRGDSSERRASLGWAARAARVGPVVALAAPVVLLGWYVWTRREGETLGLPTLLIWFLVLVGGAIGFGVQLRIGAGRGRLVAIAASVVAAAAAGALLVAGALAVGSTSTNQALAAVAVLGGAASAGGAALARLGGWRVSPAALVAAQALAMWAVIDIGVIERGVHLVEGRLQVFLFYDFHVYLAAGRNFMAGDPIYLDHVLTALPATTHQEPFLYPPVLLPVVAALASIPREYAATVFVAMLVGAGAVGLRLLGMRWTWAVLLLAFPPLFKGILSGNVASVTFLLFVAAPAAGALVVLGVLLKVQSVLPALWLARVGRWRDLATGIGALLILFLITLPFVGIESWTDYLRGLFFREESQHSIPALFGSSLAQYLPVAAFGVVSVAAVLAALSVGGRRSLALLGIATILASPSLWPHGFVMALPAALALPPTVLWLTLGIAVGGSALWALPVVAAASVFVDWDRVRPSDPVDPISGSRGPWASHAPGDVTDG